MSSADTDVKTEDKDSLPPPKKFINTNLLSLKCLLFFFFAGMGCLLPFLPLHMLAVGLSTKEIQFISMISPCIAILGPLIAGPIADRASASSSSSSSPVKNNSNPSTGRCLRLLIAVCCIFTAFFYSLLLIVPQVQRIDLPQELRPGVKFTCDSQGALIHQERCRDSIGCHRWSDEDFVGNLLLKNCEYTCSNSDSRKYRRKYSQTSPIKIPATAVFNDSPLKNDVDEDELGVIPLKTVTNRSKRQVYGDFKEPPHVCHSNKKGKDVCHVFTENEVTENVQVSLMQATNAENSDEWCIFPIQQFFLCRIPTDMEIIAAKRNETCVVECKVEQPYILEDSVLAESQCRQIFGNPQLTFWMYFGIRSLADIFPTAALSLIDAATVIATRETSLGRGDVGRQLAFGSLGFGIFGPLTGYLTTLLGPKSTSMCYPPIIISAALVLIAAFVALAAKGMPLGPPEWCWRTSSGMLALPMSSVHKYVGETTALFFILIIMGAFSSAIDTYLPLHLLHLNGDEFSIGLSLTIGAIPAIIFLWKSENFVDYCGHSNLLITAFIFYIVRFTGLSLVPDVWWSLIAGSLEFFTLGIMWITTILYFRHLIPRSMTTTGQSLPVIAHFCLGRALGAVIGANVHRFYKGDEVESMRFIYQCMAVASAIIATIYFIVYHGMLKPRCHAQSVQNNQRSHPTVVQVINGNGNYAPLRVYHSGMGRKGQFRY